jgi:putative redox protein
MADTTSKPPTVAELIWEHDLVFSAASRDARITLDSRGTEGPSPVQALVFALAGCMAMDVVHIVRKGRHELRGFRAELTAERSPTEPRRLTSVALRFTVNGDVPRDVVDRAVELSRDKYCSVWHSLREDITLAVTIDISSTSPSPAPSGA